MLKDIPYSELQKEEEWYKIMLLRDQYDNTYLDIATEMGMSKERVMQIYSRIKIKQVRLYINHISAVLGHNNTSQIAQIFDEAYDCYQDLAYATAYLEKKYEDILTEYRNGEPGTPKEFIQNMPSFRRGVSKETIARVVEMREERRASFITIAKELHMTRQKAKKIYDMFYHEKNKEICEALQAKTENWEEKNAIWHYCFTKYRSSKKTYDMLMKDFTP